MNERNDIIYDGYRPLQCYRVKKFNIYFFPCSVICWFIRRTMHNNLAQRTFFIMIILVIFALCTDSQKVRKCWKRKYTLEIRMPGVFDPNCRVNVTLNKCEGYCRSEAGPVVDGIGVRWEFRCKCCQPRKYRRRVIHFPKCGSSITIRDIKSCHCLPC